MSVTFKEEVFLLIEKFLFSSLKGESPQSSTRSAEEWKYLSQSPYLPPHFIRENLQKFDIPLLSKNEALTFDIVRENLSLFEGSIIELSENPNLREEDILLFPLEKWDFSKLIKNKNISIEFLIHMCKTLSLRSELFSNIFVREDVTPSLIESHSEINWDYQCLSFNKNFGLDYILSHSPKEWDVCFLSQRSDFTIEEIIECKDIIDWDFDLISSCCAKIPIEVVLYYSHLKWNWKYLMESAIFPENDIFILDREVDLRSEPHKGVDLRSEPHKGVDLRSEPLTGVEKVKYSHFLLNRNIPLPLLIENKNLLNERISSSEKMSVYSIQSFCSRSDLTPSLFRECIEKFPIFRESGKNFIEGVFSLRGNPNFKIEELSLIFKEIISQIEDAFLREYSLSLIKSNLARAFSLTFDFVKENHSSLSPVWILNPFITEKW